MSRSRKTTGVVAGLAVFATATLVSIAAPALEGATGIVKERADDMGEMAKAAKAMGEMFKGVKPYDAAALAKLAMVVSKEAGELPEKFPAGSGKAPSRALPVIWEKKDDFNKHFAALKADADALAAMAPKASQREALAQFVKMTKNCGGCHDMYRQKK